MLKYFCAAAVLFTLPFLAKAGTSGHIDWQKNYSDAAKLAKQQAKPILVDFWATWCKPCKAMEKEAWPNAEVQELAKRFICVSLDFDRSKSEALKFGVHAIPSVVILDPWQNMMLRQDGYGGADRLIAALSAAPTDFTEVIPLQKSLEQDAKNSEVLTALGNFYNTRDILGVANSFYRRALKTSTVAADPSARENLLVSIGINSIRLRQYEDARATLESCLKDFPEGTQCAKAMLGLVIAQVELGNKQQAERILNQLKDRYPDSPATRQAEQHFQQGKTTTTPKRTNHP